MKLSPEERLLLDLLRSVLHHQPSGSSCPGPDLVNWDKFLSLARYHRLAPLLLQGLKGEAYNLLPANVVDALRKQALEGKARSLLLLEGLRDVAREFHHIGIPFIVLKGITLAKDLYPDDLLRPYVDVDILIRRSSYEQVKSVLGGIGYDLAEPRLEGDKLAHFGEVEFVRRVGPPILLDLHWDTVLASWEPHSLLASEETWQRCRDFDLGGFSIAVLAPEELLVYLAMHLAFHHVFSGLLWFCDLFFLLRKYGNELDWERVYFQAGRFGGRRALEDTLAFARVLLDASVPASILRQLEAASLHRGLFPVRRLLLGAGPPSQGIERYVKFLLIDDMSRRARALRTWWASHKRFIGEGKTTSRSKRSSV
jgi:hypothetical protein